MRRLRPSPALYRSGAARQRSTHTVSEKTERVDEALLHKIGLLADQHARNIAALKKLRTARTAWADHQQPPSSPPLPSASDSWQERQHSLEEVEMEPRSTRWVGEQAFSSEQGESARRRCFARVTAHVGSPWKGQPTVVMPFRSMEASTTVWKRKVRQKEEHDLQLAEEEREARVRDRERFLEGIHRGKEFSGVIARSAEMMERRRQRQVIAEEQEEEARKKHAFKAKRVHITDDDWHVIQERQAFVRSQRNKLRQQEMSARSHLPRRMAMHALQKKPEATPRGEAPTTRTGRRGASSGGTQQPPSMPPERVREVLARRQRRWDERLAEAKRSRSPVTPQVLPMEKRGEMYKRRREEKRQLQQERWAAAAEETADEERRRREKAFAVAVPVVPRATHGFLLKTALVREKLEKEREATRKEEEYHKKRRIRLQETSKALAEVMRDMSRLHGTRTRRHNDQRAKEQAQACSRQYRRALKENQARLEEAMKGRPTLWERHDAQLRKEEAKRIALSSIATKVFEAGVIDGETRWKPGSAAEKIFDERERAVLGMRQA